jgi:gas vesicle protein
MKDSDILGYSLMVFGLGVLVGLLVAPHKGGETREILKKYLKEYCGETFEFITKKASQVGKKAQEYIEELKKGVEEAK